MDPKAVNELHDQSDVDSGDFSQHHTLGYGNGQAAPGKDVSRRLAAIEAAMKAHGWT